MNTFTSIIAEMGGATKAARILGTSQQNVHSMAIRNSIPARYWPVVVDSVKGVTLSDLAKMARARKPVKGEAAP